MARRITGGLGRVQVQVQVQGILYPGHVATLSHGRPAGALRTPCDLRG